MDLIIISLKINLFSSWYNWKIAELVLNNNHSLNLFFLQKAPKGMNKFLHLNLWQSINHFQMLITGLVIHPGTNHQFTIVDIYLQLYKLINLCLKFKKNLIITFFFCWSHPPSWDVWLFMLCCMFINHIIYIYIYRMIFNADIPPYLNFKC